jgi:hypothetical protein
MRCAGESPIGSRRNGMWIRIRWSVVGRWLQTQTSSRNGQKLNSARSTIVTDQPDSIPYQPLEIILIPPTPYVISSPLGEVSTLFPANNSLLRYISSRRPTRLQTQACQWTHPSPLPHLEPLLQHTATPSSLARTRAMPILHETFVPAKRPWRITVLISGSGG